MSQFIQNVLYAVRHRLLHAATLAAILFAAVGVARATARIADSGNIRWTPDVAVSGYGTTKVYLRAYTTWNDSTTTGDIFHNGIVNLDFAVGAGMLGTFIGGWKNGVLCGANGYYNDSPTSVGAWGLKFCVNDSSMQTFKTDVRAEVWETNGYAYRGLQNSPNSSN